MYRFKSMLVLLCLLVACMTLASPANARCHTSFAMNAYAGGLLSAYWCDVGPSRRQPGMTTRECLAQIEIPLSVPVEQLADYRDRIQVVIEGRDRAGTIVELDGRWAGAGDWVSYSEVWMTMPERLENPDDQEIRWRLLRDDRQLWQSAWYRCR